MGRDNNFGALRLLFAGLVIVAHSPEMLDGNRSREPLYAIFGTLTFGRVAVDAFFLISGYLITSSFVNSSGVTSYLFKRVLRIYPAFLVCSLICLFVVAPLGGGDLAKLSVVDWAKSAVRLILLRTPEVQGSFEGQHYPSLNGAAWTIGYEFRCYVLAALLGIAGLYSRRLIYLACTIFVLAVNVSYEPWIAPYVVNWPAWLTFAIGDPIQNARLVSAFMVGTCYWLYRDKIVYSSFLVVFAAIVMTALLFSPLLAESALILLGGYMLFWVAIGVDWKFLRSINADNDISYGLYLYGWPIAALMIWYWPSIPVVVLGAGTYAGAALAGMVSWFVIEKPAMRLKSLYLGSERAARDVSVAADGS